MSHLAFNPAAPLIEEWVRSIWDIPLAKSASGVAAESKAAAAQVLAAFAASASVIRDVNVVDPRDEWNIIVRANLGDQPFDVLRFLPLNYEGTLLSDGVKTVAFSGKVSGVLVRVCAVFPDRSPYPAIIRRLWMYDESGRDTSAMAGHLRLKVAAERI